MPKARSAQISVSDTPYYHCVSRCVRRAFLCGKDNVTNRNYEHRRQWVEDRIHFLARVFTIDVCAYAVMSNHTHLVLRINAEKVKQLSIVEIIVRWQKVFNGTLLSRSYLGKESRENMRETQISTVIATAEVWRKRLCDISWFMRCLNEFIARQANKEDKCTGRFWEGRFKSQALLDESVVLACMAYVDLNPVRARMASTPEESKHTSIHARIEAARQKTLPKHLIPFTGNHINSASKGLPFSLVDYIQLVDLTGRQIRQGKKGAISSNELPILERLGLACEHWVELSIEFEKCFSCAAGKLEYLERYAKNNGMQRVSSRSTAIRLFNTR